MVFPFSLWWMIWYSIPYDDRIPYDGIWYDVFWWSGGEVAEDKSLRTSGNVHRTTFISSALWGSAFSRHLSFSLMRAFPLAVLVLDLTLQGVLDRKLGICRVESGTLRFQVSSRLASCWKLEIPGYPGYPGYPPTFLVALCGCFRLVNPIYGSCTVESVPQDIFNIL